MEEDIKALADSIRQEKIERARQTDPAEKLLLGPRLFDAACNRMRDGIRHQFPDADEQQVEEILDERLSIAERRRNYAT